MKSPPTLLERLALALLTLLAVPAAGFLLAFPLWYLSTHLRLVYTVTVAGGTLYLLMRDGYSKRSQR